MKFHITKEWLLAQLAKGDEPEGGILAVSPEILREMERSCPACCGNNADMPCAFPGENMEGCLRDKERADGRS